MKLYQILSKNARENLVRRCAVIFFYNGPREVKEMNLLKNISRELNQVSELSLPELIDALEHSDDCSVSRITALTLAKRAAEGGMDAIKLIRELSRGEEEPQSLPAVEIRIIEP